MTYCNQFQITLHFFLSRRHTIFLYEFLLLYDYVSFIFYSLILSHLILSHSIPQLHTCQIAGVQGGLLDVESSERMSAFNDAKIYCAAAYQLAPEDAQVNMNVRA